MSQDRVVVRLPPGCSDGDVLHVPKQGHYTQVEPPTLYLMKTAQQWMQRKGKARPGVTYILESLPTGYTMWQRPRPSKPSHVDKYLYGHPGHKYFDSPNRFYLHFEHLMENNGSSIGCLCKLCAGTMGVLPKSSSSSARVGSSSTASSRPTTPRGPAPRSASAAAPLQRSAAPVVRSPIPSALVASIQPVQPKGRPKLISAGVDSSRVDEEGTVDIYRNLIEQLRRHTAIDEMIEEPLSPDWRAEQEILLSVLQGFKKREQWVPRIGDIILYVREMRSGADFVRHEVTGEYQLYDEESEELLGSPLWEAGLVGEVPAEQSSVADLYANANESNVIYSGVRVEPLPDPNGTDKSLSKRHRYIPLRQTRPFVLWKELLQQVPQDQWHVTVINALTVTSTLSLVGKYRFRGTWPKADIYCHGLHIGHEMFAVGDTIRLLPNRAKQSQTQCADILVIKSIRLKWSNMDVASDNDYDEGRPYNSEVWIYGAAYTSDTARMNNEDLSDGNAEPPKAASAYGEWHPLHPTTKELAVPYSRVLGRLHEREAMSFWLNSEADDHLGLDAGRDGLMEARAFACQNDQRIVRALDATWYWGDNRADALNLQTINGLEIAKYDQERDIRDMRKNIKVIEGLENGKPGSGGKSKALASLGSRGLRSFMAPGTSLPDRTQVRRDVSRSVSAAGGSSTGESVESRKKRAHIVNLSDNDDEENEIREHTKVVENGPSIGKKKAKVMVLID